MILDALISVLLLLLCGLLFVAVIRFFLGIEYASIEELDEGKDEMFEPLDNRPAV